MTRKRLRPTTANHCRLRLEALEVRDVPATPVTSGAGTSYLLTLTPQTSKDGNYVLFESDAGDLQPGVSGAAGQQNLYWKDLTTGRTELVTRKVGTLQAVGFDGGAVLSGNGKFVAFDSIVSAPTLTGDPSNADSSSTPFSDDVFWWSADAPNACKLISMTTTGSAAGAFAPQISFDGQIVAFVSSRNANELDTARTVKWEEGGLELEQSVILKDDGASEDIFRRDLSRDESTPTGFTPWIETVTRTPRDSHNVLGVLAGGWEAVEVSDRYMDESGTKFCFTTFVDADLILPTANTDRTDTRDVFVRDTSLDPGDPNAMRLVSVARDGRAIGNVAGQGAGEWPILSGNGTAVLFDATAPGGAPGRQLVDNYVNNNGGKADLYVATDVFRGGPVRLVSAAGGTANQGSNADEGNQAIAGLAFARWITPDGRFVLFNSNGTNLVDPARDANGAGADAFVRDVAAGTTEFVALGNRGQTVEAGAESFGSGISDDGRFVAFTTTASAQNLVGVIDTNNGADVLVRDRKLGTTRVASIAANGRATLPGFSSEAVINGGGTRIFFWHSDVFFQATVAAGQKVQLFTALLPLPSPLSVSDQVAVSGSANGQAQTFAFDDSGNLVPAGSPVTPFAGFGGDVRTAVADVDGDGTPDTVYGVGPGGGSKITVVSGATGKVLASLDSVYEPTFTGGVFLAAGDMEGDGRAEIVVSPDQGGGGRVVVFKLNGANNGLDRVADFFGIEDPAFRGGARVALGDVNGDGTLDLIVAAGFGGGPRVAVFDGNDVLAHGNAPQVRKLTSDFFVFEQALRNGVYVGAGDIDGDGKSDLVFGGGPGGGPRVMVLAGADVSTGNADLATNRPLANFFAGDTAQRGGIRVAAKDVDADNLADLVTGSGEGFPAHMRTYAGKGVLAAPNGQEPSLLQDLPAFGGGTSAAGVFVG